VRQEGAEGASYSHYLIFKLAHFQIFKLSCHRFTNFKTQRRQEGATGAENGANGPSPISHGINTTAKPAANLMFPVAVS
jgi:hypothetical protein